MGQAGNGTGRQWYRQDRQQDTDALQYRLSAFFEKRERYAIPGLQDEQAGGVSSLFAERFMAHL